MLIYRIIFFVLLMLSFQVFSNELKIIAPKELEDTSSVLILDQSDDLSDFRTINDAYPQKSIDAFLKDKDELPSRKGLENLKVSGSAQFSRKGLDILLEKLHVKDLIIVDLRRESHGFINGLPVSWMNIETGLSNVNLNLQEILDQEKTLLKEAQKEKDITIYKIKKSYKDAIIELTTMPVAVESISTESNLCAEHALGYMRIPVSDHRKPFDKEVDAFIAFYRQRPEGSWIHLHCKGGVGRTAVFFIMVDMMHNAKNLSFETIIQRQVLINGTNITEPQTFLSKKFITEFHARYQFLKDFYVYCKNNQDDFQTSWTSYMKK